MKPGRTRTWIAVATTLAAVGMLAASTGLAAQGRGGRGPFGGALRHLDLTDAQRTEIRSVVREHREGGAELRRELMAALAQLRDATSGEVVNETTIRALAAAAAPLQADAAVRRAQHNAAVLALLTADQRTQLREMRENARENRRARRQGRRGAGN